MNLKEICDACLNVRNLHEDLRYSKRLKWEIDEIIAKDKEDYFLDLYRRKVKYPVNQNNLLVCWLLGIAPNHNIEIDPASTYGDMMDIDVDYIPVIRDFLKNEWAPKEFGADKVCNIGSYTTFGIKNALIDMARVHGESRDEVLAITKNLDLKDDEGKVLTWEAALRLYPEFKKYTESYPEIAEAAKRLLHRNRGTGVHAGGLIIAKDALHEFVPLMKRKDAPQASAWVEGLHGQDLQPVGLIKFDLLVVSNLLQIALGCDLVKKRHNLTGICALPGQPDWSDVDKWRNDSASINMSNAADLKGIFQFDSDGIRALVRMGGVDCFEDMVAYSALYRPGPLGMKMQERYIERKKGREKFDLHPLVKPILQKTYGVICYQEQIMLMLNVVGEIPLKDCYAVIKAVSKKKIEGFAKYKEMFLEKGKKNLGVNDEEIGHLWSQIEAFAEYGFNLSHAVSYNYISFYLLYLKSHYPHEFYTSILGCESQTDKIKEYKMEAKNHGVQVNRLDINESKSNFELKGEVIYYGISKIKGIGEAPAERILQHQPYKSFEDFLIRFGTDASVLKPLVALRCFKDSDPVTLWKFSVFFKEHLKKYEDKKKRLLLSLQKYEDQFKKLVPAETRMLADLVGDDPFSEEEWNKYDINHEIVVKKKSRCKPGEGDPRLEVFSEDIGEGVSIDKEAFVWYKTRVIVKKLNTLKELKNLWERRKRSLARKAIQNVTLPKLSEFNPHEHGMVEELMLELSDSVLCEEKYYGFAWDHELEFSPDYKGNCTFEALKSNDSVGPVEMKVKKVTKITNKKGTVYHQVVAEDVNGQENKINVWKEDYERWGQELKVGNLLRLRLQPPSGGWNTFTLESNQVGKWRNQKRYEEKADDPRVLVMGRGVQQKEKFLSDTEALEKFTNCIMDKLTEKREDD